MPYYYNNNKLTALLCLAYHIGQVQYVPVVIYDDGSSIHLVDTEPSESLFYTACDVLQVKYPEPRTVGTDQHPYWECLISFLQDPGRSGSYAIGPVTYTQATLFFMERISPLNLVSASEEYTSDGEESEECTSEEESYMSSNVTFHNNQWALDEPFNEEHDMIMFLCLGYIFFFLPRSGKSQPLLEHCQTQVFLTHYVIRHFPERTALVRRAMQEYLNRFGRESSSADGEDCDTD